MLIWLMSPAFVLLGAPTSWAEVLGFGTGLVTVWLVVRQHVANWPLGIANVLLLLVVFLNAALYADAALQVCYVLLGVYGWHQWLRGGPGAAGLAVRRTTGSERWGTR